MESRRNPLSSKAVVLIVAGATIVMILAEAVVGITSHKSTEDRGLSGFIGGPSSPLPDGIGPFKLGMTKEEIEKEIDRIRDVRREELERQEKEAAARGHYLSDAQEEAIYHSGAWYERCGVTYDLMNGGVYRLQFGDPDHHPCGRTQASWAPKVVDETISKYGKPDRFTQEGQDLDVGHSWHILMWRDGQRELVWRIDKWPPLKDTYSASLTDLRLQAEQARRVKEESDRKAKEALERDIADAVKKLY